jgi:hypothetical protein
MAEMITQPLCKTFQQASSLTGLLLKSKLGASINFEAVRFLSQATTCSNQANGTEVVLTPSDGGAGARSWPGQGRHAMSGAASLLGPAQQNSSKAYMPGADAPARTT